MNCEGSRPLLTADLPVDSVRTTAGMRLLCCVIMIQLLMFFLLLCFAPAFLDGYCLLSCVITVHSSRLVMSASALIYSPCLFAQGASDCVFTHSKPTLLSYESGVT
ncbi:hypothetical protein CRENBAI_000803 [Crenichthys baileyi]|uniref:Uncharacterized protein n=1 Tax=Crenichthys baileyi TaxID=28760 RepID=A0AAV9QNZ0_9TELE